MRPISLTLACVAAAASLAAQAPMPTGTLVVSNMNDNTATILDAGTGRVLATLATGEGPHEVAVSQDGHWAIVSNYGIRGKPGNTLTVIDIVALKVLRTITLTDHQRPHGAAFFPGDTIFAVTSEVSQAVVLVDVRNGHVLGTIPTKGRSSHMLAMNGAGDRIYTGNIADGTVSMLDAKTRAHVRSFAVGRSPEGIATSPSGNVVYAGSNSDNIVVIYDALRGTAVDTLRDFGMPYRLAVSPDGESLVITDPVRAVVRVFDPETRKQKYSIAIPKDSLVATAEIPGSPSPEGVVISSNSHWAFVTLQGRNRVVTIDLTTGKIVGYAKTGAWSDGIGYSRLKSP